MKAILVFVIALLCAECNDGKLW